MLAPAALAPAALAERLARCRRARWPWATGRYASEAARGGRGAVPPDEDGVHRLSAEQVCRLGAAGEPADRDALLPDYLREPDAVAPQR